MEKYIILGHENPDIDSIISGYLLETLMKKKGYDAEFIIPDKTISKEDIDLSAYCGIDPTTYQKSLPTTADTKYILVDHHERNVPGEIVAIIDHHPTKTKDIKCKYYYNSAACSTSCIITKNHERYFYPDDIKKACFAAMVDTAGFHSNKTVFSDYIWVKHQCLKYGFNYEDMLTTSIAPTNISNTEEACLNGLKTYNINNYKVASSFLHLQNPNENQEQINDMITHIQKYMAENNYDIFAFIVHDITNFKTKLYKIKETEIEETFYDEYTARGTKIIPELTEELTAYQKKKTPTINDKTKK